MPPTPGQPARMLIDRHRDLAQAADAVLDRLASARRRVAELVHAQRETAVQTELDRIAIERLGDITDKNLRVGALRNAGFTTVGSLRGVAAGVLDDLEGVGPHTARSAVAAVQQLTEAIEAGFVMRIELDPNDASGTALLAELNTLLRLTPAIAPHGQMLADYCGVVAPLTSAARPTANRLTFAFRRRRIKRHALEALAALAGTDPWLAATGLPAIVEHLTRECARAVPGPLALWDDFEARSITYYTALGEIVPLAASVVAGNGMLPAELADRVAAHELDQSLLRAQLRGYQAFGAKFALNQGRALLGDEMGLGKTVQAIAAMAHCAAKGDTHFLVVCPASVLINWLREIERHSALRAHRLHGQNRAAAAEEWMTAGGVAVTTFEGLRHVPTVIKPGAAANPHGALGVRDVERDGARDVARDGATQAPVELGMLVVDEAHFVKNPAAARSREVAAWADSCLRVLFMTGTPMENRLDEFLALVRYLQPALARDVPRHAGYAGANTFRATVAPVYLRRNTQDVLVEIPELVAIEEWEEFTQPGERVYSEAVAAGNFMAMRRADFATADPADSSKLGRLQEVLADAALNGHKVVVFSYFRGVVDVVLRAVGTERVHGPISGDVPAQERQRIVDAFTAAAPGAVLVSQIQAGGVGLNIQAASVVVLCEPQLKPTTEAQAIARVRRMGQVRTVRVHRLLIEDSVDERIREMLAEKERLFDQYVRESSLAAETTRSVDVTEAQLARDVVSAEQARLGYGPVWDELMGSDGADPDAAVGADVLPLRSCPPMIPQLPPERSPST